MASEIPDLYLQCPIWHLSLNPSLSSQKYCLSLSICTLLLASPNSQHLPLQLVAHLFLCIYVFIQGLIDLRLASNSQWPETPDPLCCHLPSTGISGVLPHPVYMVLGNQTLDLIHVKQALYHQGYNVVHSFLFLLTEPNVQLFLPCLLFWSITKPPQQEWRTYLLLLMTVPSTLNQPRLFLGLWEKTRELVSPSLSFQLYSTPPFLHPNILFVLLW